MLTEFLRDARGLVYPGVCVHCESLNADREADFCSTCIQSLTHDPHRACPRCGSTVADFADLSAGCPRCRDERFRFDSVSRLGPYDDRLREAILRMKHRSGETLAECLGLLWARHQARCLAELGVDCVIPIPLHWSRRFVRGYTQTECLSSAAARQLNIPHLRFALKRVRATPRQVHQTATARRNNLKGAFRAARTAQLAERKVLLVDDVMTTGTTANDAARALKEAGAKTVHVAVLAHQ